MDGPSETGVPPVGSDGDVGSLRGHRTPPLVPAADTGKSLAIGYEVLDHEALPQLCAGLDGGVEQDLVQRRAPWPVAHRNAVDREVPANQRKVIEIHGYRGDGRAAGGQDLVEQAPAVKASGAVLVDKVPARDVAWEGGPVCEQHLVALSRQ